MFTSALVPESTERLAAQLMEILKPLAEANDSAPSSPGTLDAAKQAAIARWTCVDVSEWLTEAHIDPRIAARWRKLGMDGQAVIGLLLLRRDRSLVKTLKVDLCVRDPVQMLHLVYALETLAE